MTLQQKLAERKLKQSAEAARAKLASVPGLSLEGFDANPELVGPADLWRCFSSHEQIAQFRIPDRAFSDTGPEILQQSLALLGHDLGALCFSVSGHGDLPWLRTVPNHSFSLFQMFKAVGDFIAMEPRSGAAVCVMEDEYEKLVFVKPTIGRTGC